MKKKITLTLNGSQIHVTADSHQSLLDVLRNSLRLTGTKEGCGEGECGACTVLIDSRAVNSCLYPAFEAGGKNVTTIEGVADKKNQLATIQQAFVDNGAIQCGFCTPGMIISAKALLDTHPNPTEAEIREALSGNLCRCTGYVQIVEAVKKAANRLRDKP
ncbi:MAG: (2Fe-2S)-binding protein [Candidatus Aminicenantes bacterium]|nr:MAG: (2Fe-2S)-binding protein [Candidatus Aminicenantes bacterium]